MKKYTFLLTLTLLLSNEPFLINGFKIDLISNKNIEISSHFENSSNNFKPILYSSIIPGLGEFSIGYKKRAYIFFTMELIFIGSWFKFNNDGLDAQGEYRKYANTNWSFERWLYDYYKWQDIDNPYRYNFINQESGNYPDIWDDSHHINFNYNGNTYSTNSEEFKNFYLSENFEDKVLVEDFFENNTVIIEKDHHYYENIGKYDHFFAGWNDNDSIYIIVKDLGGEKIAMSPFKSNYRKKWNESNDYYRIASYALSAIVANHVTSIVDMIILTKTNAKITDLMIRPYFSPINSYGIGGFNFSFSWD